MMSEISAGSVVVLAVAYKGRELGVYKNRALENIVLTVIQQHSMTSVRKYNPVYTHNVFTITTFDGVYTARKDCIVMIIELPGH